jgi:hypothetical protein
LKKTTEITLEICLFVSVDNPVGKLKTLL